MFVDGGGYVGDTSRCFLKYCGKPKMIYLWEPDSLNQIIIPKYLRGVDYEIIPKALWNEKAKLKFRADASSVSKIDKKGEVIVEADSIDNLLGDKSITFIKMDIEGAEYNALLGAKRVITEQKPKLAICIYHSYEDYYRIPLLIKEMVPE